MNLCTFLCRALQKSKLTWNDQILRGPENVPTASFSYLELNALEAYSARASFNTDRHAFQINGKFQSKIERMHSRDKRPYLFNVTKGIFCITKEFKIDFKHQHGVSDVICIRSTETHFILGLLPVSVVYAKDPYWARPYYAGGIWKRNNHWTFWICVSGKKLGQGNHVINVTPSFAILKMTQNNWHIHKASS